MEEIRRGSGGTIVTVGAPGKAHDTDAPIDGGRVVLAPGDVGYDELDDWLTTYERNLADARRIDPTLAG